MGIVIVKTIEISIRTYHETFVRTCRQAKHKRRQQRQDMFVLVCCRGHMTDDMSAAC
jgi:hypothetical protein